MTTESVARRNDPCPCGSGKKYKKCCMKKLEKVDDSVLHLLRQEFEGLNKTLFSFSKRYFDKDLNYAIQKIFQSMSVPYSFKSRSHIFLTLWAIFNVPVRNERTPFETFLNVYKKEKRREKAVEMVESWKEAHFSAYTIQSVTNDGLIKVKDVWTSITSEATIPNGRTAPSEDSLLIGLLVPIHDGVEDFLFGYLEIENHLWSEEKLQWIRQNFLNDSERSIGDQLNQTLPDILAHLLVGDSHSMTQPEAEANETVWAQESSDKPQQKGNDEQEASAESLVENLDKAVPTQQELSFSGTDAQKEALLMYLENIDQDAIHERTLNQVTSIWQAFVSEENPIIKKPEGYAAALDYLASTLDENAQATQAAISQKYGVSSATVSKNYRLLNEFANQALLQTV